MKLLSKYKWLITCLVMISLGWISLTGISLKGGSDDLPDRPDFNFDIRPILSQNCFLCHGPDSSSRKAGLRLDTYEGATAERKDGNPAIVPGNPSKSLLLHKVSSHDPEEVMPPPETNKKLTEREIALLNKWIDQGAKWKPYWAFISPKSPKIPRIKDLDSNSPIDAFVQQKLRDRGLNFSPKSDKATLFRRLSYLLTGLPPDPKDVDAFVVDTSPDAYTKSIDRFLASPHFGERWARHWMDLVRYAETKGHEFDYPVGGAPAYRDYLIRAFNADIPYDEFVKEQLAGDLISNPRIDPKSGINESKLATVYYHLGEGKHSPVDIKKEESDVIDNIIDVTSKTFQGLTVGCAKCHDHKFDPIPTTDYYSMYGIFESMRFTPIEVDRHNEREQTYQEITQLNQNIRTSLAKKWLSEIATKNIEKFNEDFQPESQSDSLSAGIWLGNFRNNNWGEWTAYDKAFCEKPSVGELKIDRRKKTIKGFYSGRASGKMVGTGVSGALRSPTFQLNHDKILVRAAGKKSRIRIIMDNFQLIQNPIYGNLNHDVDDPKMKDYIFDLRQWKGHKVYIELLHGEFDRHHYSIDPSAYLEAEYAFAFDGEIPPQLLASKGKGSRISMDSKKAIEAWQSFDASSTQIKVLNRLLAKRWISPNLDELEATLAQVDTLKTRLYDPSQLIAVSEGDYIKSPVFIRGNHLQLSDTLIPHRFFTAIRPDTQVFTSTGRTRLEFAEAIVAPTNPLTARVMVNRIWHHLMGRGIVESVDNFGLQGKLPTHPELLDHLALTFIEKGWSIKQMIRYILLSHTFQQSSKATEIAIERDPQNLLLHHYSIRRLESEAIRDAMLVASGCLDSTLMGPSIPIHLTPFMKGRGRPWKSGPLDGAGRRSLYTSIRRNFLPPMMLTFDMPIPFSSFGKRNISNVPAQSLMLMNDPFVHQQAKYWAEKLMRDYPDPHNRIHAAYRVAYSRLPDMQEQNDAQAFLIKQAQSYCMDDSDWDTYLPVWEDFCHVMINQKEFIYLQ